MNFIDKALQRTSLATKLEMEGKNLQEKIRSSGFKWNDFVKIGRNLNFDDAAVLQRRYAQGHLKFLGEGSAREVYLLSSRHVLKIPKRGAERIGIDQNLEEEGLSRKFSGNSLLAHVVRSGQDGLWLVSELVRPLPDNREFYELTGFYFRELMMFADVPREEYEAEMAELELLKINIQDLQDEMEEAVANEEDDVVEELSRQIKVKERMASNLSEMRDLRNRLGVMVDDLWDLIEAGLSTGGDLKKISHWGKTPDGRVVLLDYGLSDAIWNRHYA